MATDPTGATILLGPRSWGKRQSTAGAIIHTTEYPSASEAHAKQCILDQSKRTSTGGWAQPGSYNWILYDGGAYLAVPYLEGSGGLSPSSSAWAPERFPWLKTMLGDAAYSNPTMHNIQIAISGRTTDLLYALSIGRAWMRGIIDNAARIIVWTEKQAWARDNLVVSGHLHWQTNRSDPGQPILDAIVARAIELGNPPAPAPLPDYKVLYEGEVAKVRTLADRVSLIKGKVAKNAADIAKD